MLQGKIRNCQCCMYFLLRNLYDPRQVYEVGMSHVTIAVSSGYLAEHYIN